MNQWYSIINQIICNLVKISNISLSYRDNWTLDLLIHQPKATLFDCNTFGFVILHAKLEWGKISRKWYMGFFFVFFRNAYPWTIPETISNTIHTSIIFKSLTTSLLSLLTSVITISCPYDHLTLFHYPSTWKWKKIKLTCTFSYPWYLH